jgi:hypothetical protein
MTETTTASTDLGNGWMRQGNCTVWAGEPRTEGSVFDHGRDLLRLSMWRAKADDAQVLGIETGKLDNDDDPADTEAVADSLDRFSVDRIYLPRTALPELVYFLARIIGPAVLFEVVDRMNSERGEYLERLTAAVGGNMTATLGEAEAALKAQEGGMA